jgi:hypothetical protein
MPDSPSEYKPGHCNIGAKELTVRRKFLGLFLVITLLLSAGGLNRPGSVLIWIALVFASFSVVVLWMEVRYHFCILFGFFGLHNFKTLGHLDEVKSPEHHRTDRKRVTQIVIVSMMVALIYSTAIHLIGQG